MVYFGCLSSPPINHHLTEQAHAHLHIMEDKLRERGKLGKRKVETITGFGSDKGPPPQFKRKRPMLFGPDPEGDATPTTATRTRAKEVSVGGHAVTQLSDVELEKDLDERQVQVYRYAMKGRSLFFTGSAGTGKSFLLHRIRLGLTCLRQRIVSVMAPTGVAALNVDGETLHNFVGVGMGIEENVHYILKKIESNRALKEKFCDVDTIIIDEVSMVDPDHMEKLDAVLMAVRGNQFPFGGVQMILCGDFFQLPPVINLPPGVMPGDALSDHSKRCVDNRSEFSFDAPAWWRLNPKPFILTKIFRQKDETFIKILANVRMGSVTRNDIAVLSKRMGRAPTIDPRVYEKFNGLEALVAAPSGDGNQGGVPFIDEGFIQATRIYGRKRDVEKFNMDEFARIRKPTISYTARIFPRFMVSSSSSDSGGGGDSALPLSLGRRPMAAAVFNYERKRFAKSAVASFIKNCGAKRVIHLKQGAQVMLLANIDVRAGLVNGSRGIIVGWWSSSMTTPSPPSLKKNKKKTRRGKERKSPSEDSSSGSSEGDEDDDEESARTSLGSFSRPINDLEARVMEEKANAEVVVDFDIKFSGTEEDGGRSQLAVQDIEWQNRSASLQSKNNSGDDDDDRNEDGVWGEGTAIKALMENRCDTVTCFDEKSKGSRVYPVVLFRNGTTRIIQPFEFRKSDASLQMEVVYRQIPLVHAWAYSIHKSQGQSLDLVEVTVSHDIFEKGQAYVGLSRATSLEGLYIPKFDASVIAAHPRVKRFYELGCCSMVELSGQPSHFKSRGSFGMMIKGRGGSAIRGQPQYCQGRGRGRGRGAGTTASLFSPHHQAAAAATKTPVPQTPRVKRITKSDFFSSLSKT